MNHSGYAFATNMLMDNRRPVRFMYREAAAGQDSGWRFFCGDEDQAYADNPGNLVLCSIQDILDIDPSVRPFLSAMPPAAFERENEAEPFVCTDFTFEPEEY